MLLRCKLLVVDLMSQRLVIFACKELLFVPKRNSTTTSAAIIVTKMTDWVEGLHLDKDDLKEGIVLFCVLLLVSIFITLTCCVVKRRSEDTRRRKEHMTEEARDFFSFHEAMPHSIPREPGPLLSLYRSTVVSLTGNKSYKGHPYPNVHQTPFCLETKPFVGGAAEDSPVVLGAGQHMATPLYPPSFFQSSAVSPASAYDAMLSRDFASLPPKTPPPPYRQ